MSKKTQAITDAIEKLRQIRGKLEELNETLNSQELENYSFEMKQELSLISFWFQSLYTGNGKSTSAAKKQSSRENGKKGGRPPKEITFLRRRASELEETVIPQLEHDIRFSDEPENAEKMKSELASLQKELEKSQAKISEWENSRND